MTIRSTCPYCGTGCGVLLNPDGAGGLTVTGDPQHPANFGRLCVKGSALGETLSRATRLTSPRIGGQEATWEEALATVAARFAETIAAHGPNSVALYLSGQLLTEDYYVANKLMKGYIGSANVDTNSRLCMASSVAGHRRAFGTDTVPGRYEDLEQADLVVLTGSNLAWCHPVLYQRLMAAKAARPALQILVLDPRRTATCEGADLHLPLAAGSDVHLFNALLCYLADHGFTQTPYRAHVEGFEAALQAARASDPASVSAATGLSPAQIAQFCALWAGAEKVVTVYSQGVNQAESGTDKVNAILNCHLATGRIGGVGQGPFSVTGQPNAMGGREVGGLANMLACHLELENPSHRAAVQGFWASPTMASTAGLKAVELFRAVEAGEIKALWILHTNPVVSLPEADRVARALKACPFVVVSDVTAATDTARLSDVLLPAAAWAEKNGTVTNSERVISRQRAALPALGKPDWWQLAQVARRMGFAGFEWPDEAAIFAEYAALSGVAAAQGRDFDISAHAQITAQAYADLAPFAWPAPAQGTGKDRFFSDGQFYTASGKGQMVAVEARLPAALGKGQFRLNTGRLRDQWHTMTRTGLAPKLARHRAEPCLEIHPEDARALGLQAGHLARLSNAQGAALLKVQLQPDVPRGNPFAPIHWTGETAPSARIDALVPAVVDPISGQPASKSAVVEIAPFAAAWYGFVLSAAPLSQAQLAGCDYWCVAPEQAGYRYEIAGSLPHEGAALAQALFGQAPSALVTDQARGLYRAAFCSPEGRLLGALYLAPSPLDLAREYLGESLGQPPALKSLLAGQPAADQPDAGPTVCACFNVGLHTILRAIAAQGLVSVEQVSQALKAGSNCGSCRPEIASLLAKDKIAAE